MDNKLSELSNPVAWASQRHIETRCSIEAFTDEESAKGTRWEKIAPLYSQEYVSALLAELEASKQYAKERDAENESIALTVGRLHTKLATPVRLPTEHELHQVACSECAGNCLELVESIVRAAGFTVGDEYP